MEEAAAHRYKVYFVVVFFFTFATVRRHAQLARVHRPHRGQQTESVLICLRIFLGSFFYSLSLRFFGAIRMLRWMCLVHARAMQAEAKLPLIWFVTSLGRLSKHDLHTSWKLLTKTKTHIYGSPPPAVAYISMLFLLKKQKLQ